MNEISGYIGNPSNFLRTKKKCLLCSEFRELVNTPTRHSYNYKKASPHQNKNPLIQNIYLCQNFAKTVETSPQWKGAHIMLGQFSLSSSNSKVGNGFPVSYELRIRQRRVFIQQCWGELNRAGSTSKELQSFIQGQLCLLVVELEIKVRTPPSFSCPVFIGPNCFQSIVSQLWRIHIVPSVNKNKNQVLIKTHNQDLHFSWPQ